MRALRGLVFWAYERHRRGTKGHIIVLASGLVLGESVASLVGLALTAMRAPQLGNGG